VATAKVPRILIDPTTTGRWRFQLTAGERQVLAVVAFGASVTEIARGLHLSDGTVCNRIRSAIDKMDARNRVDALRIAV